MPRLKLSATVTVVGRDEIQCAPALKAIKVGFTTCRVVNSSSWSRTWKFTSRHDLCVNDCTHLFSRAQVFVAQFSPIQSVLFDVHDIDASWLRSHCSPILVVYSEHHATVGRARTHSLRMCRILVRGPGNNRRPASVSIFESTCLGRRVRLIGA